MPTTFPQSTFIPDLIFLFVEELGYSGFGQDVFKGAKSIVPAGVARAVTIIPTGGLGDEGTHNLSRDTIAYERPSGQLVFRGDDWNAVNDAAQQAFFGLNFLDRFVNNTWWRVCAPKGEVYELPVDEKGRARLVFNLDSVKRLSPATS